MIRSRGFSPHIAPLSRFRHDQEHVAYKRAKAGLQADALPLVLDLAFAWLYEHRCRFPPELLFVEPHARESTGDHAIPQTLAAVCAAVYQGQVDTEIVQSDQGYHTGADPMERIAARAQFEDLVKPRAHSVLIDDVTTLGGALAELANFIEAFGCVIKDGVVLVNAGRDPALSPVQKYVQLIKELFDDEITKIFGIEPAALTANEARYLVGFESGDALRNRVAKTEQEIDSRLRSILIGRENKAASSGAHANQGVTPFEFEADDSA